MLFRSVKDTNVTNQSSSTHGGATASASVTSGTVSPEDQNKESIGKAASSVTKQNITWTATIGVPAIGLSEAVLTDTLPQQWVGRTYVVEEPASYTDADIKISGLADGEMYVIAPVTSDGRTTGFTVTFYRDAAKSVPSLKATGSRRQITVTYTTANNENWVTDQPTTAHTNNVTFN